MVRIFKAKKRFIPRTSSAYSFGMITVITGVWSLEAGFITRRTSRVAHMLTGTVDCLDLLPLGRQRQIFMWKADRRLCFAVRFVHDEDRKARALRNTFAAADALLFVQARQIDNGVAYADRTEFTRTFTGVARDRLDAFDHSDRRWRNVRRKGSG